VTRRRGDHRRLAGRPRRRDQRGFTLVEVMVSATILLLAMAVIGPMLTSMVRNTNRVSSEAEALDVARLALRRLGADVQGAGCVAAPASGVSAAQLLLVGRDATGAAVPIVWSVAGGVLTRTVTAAGNAVAVVELDDLVGAPTVFTRLADGRVDVHLTVSIDAGSRQRPLGTIVGARAPEVTCPA
jgi:prepilin-type N-terminal cleavage/methylation domain-containing protein